MSKKNKLSGDKNKDKHKEIIEYWTKERMENAKPLELGIDTSSNSDSILKENIINKKTYKYEEE